MAFTEDLHPFLSTDDFAVAAVWTPAVGSPATVNGVFSDGFQDPGGGYEVDAGGSQPEFVCRESDVPNVKINDTLYLNSTQYTIVHVQPDGTGLMTLVLEKQ